MGELLEAFYKGEAEGGAAPEFGLMNHDQALAEVREHRASKERQAHERKLEEARGHYDSVVSRWTQEGFDKVHEQVKERERVEREAQEIEGQVASIKAMLQELESEAGEHGLPSEGRLGEHINRLRGDQRNLDQQFADTLVSIPNPHRDAESEARYATILQEMQEASELLDGAEKTLADFVASKNAVPEQGEA